MRKGNELQKAGIRKMSHGQRKVPGSRLYCVLAGLLTAVLLTGCGASAPMEKLTHATYDSAESESMSAGAGNGFSSMDSMGMPESGAADGEAVAVQDNRKLIKNVDMSVETKEFDNFMATLESNVRGCGGYIESSEIYNGSSYTSYRSSRNATLTLRIPQQHLDAFLAEVSGISNVVRRSDSVRDVTLAYVDMESHRDALKTEQARLLELVEQAESLEDILVIEERLTQIRYQLESMESQLRTMDNQVEYSTVYLNVSEVKELTPVEEATVGQRIADGFGESLTEIGDGATELFVWFVVSIPYLLIWAVVITVIVLLVKRIFFNKKKHEKKNNEIVADKVMPNQATGEAEQSEQPEK